MSATYITTHSGRHVDLINPQPETLNIEDIAISLAREVRFNGASSRAYSVAEHSLLVMHLTPEPYKIYGLLHDAHEAFIGDITAPVYNVITSENTYTAINMLKNRLDKAIYAAARVAYPCPEAKEAVHTADMQALAIEWRLLMHAPKHHLHVPPILVSETEIERVLSQMPRDGWNVSGAFLEAYHAIIGEFNND